MVTITLPDNSIRSFEKSITGAELASSIGAKLAKDALAIKVNGKLKDLSDIIKEDSKVEIITDRSEDSLEIIRHDSAHILAQALKELYPDCQITIGPVIEDGFYYDISYHKSLTPEDLEKIEAKMLEIYKADIPVTREVWDRDKAIEYFKSIKEFYKAEIISSIPEGEEVSLYRQGDFIDLCRGPHAPSTGKAKAFKLLRLAGAYWRGDSKNEMLQRIYGTAWRNDKELKEYLHRLEEAEKRDHRRLGKELGLFHLQEEAPGQIFWHDKGWTIYKTIESYIRNKLRKHDYIEVKTPTLADKVLWDKSGHTDKFADNMFFLNTKDEKVLALKPMNCPLHIQIFNHSLKSYRELPLRMAEFGSCHRHESSGSMHGIMRTYGFVQDDAHIFCEFEQINEETVKFTALLKEVYADFGFTDVRIKLSDMPENHAGSKEVWVKAIETLKNAIEKTGLEYSLNPGEGAFYGPKLEFVLKDAVGRDWQCGTLQLDFILPERLDANYIGRDGSKHRPVMLHRAILGSLERFIGILIEEYSGKFPLWLAPVQVAVTTITDELNDYAAGVSEKLKEKGFRVELDLSNDKINYKIRKHSISKIPLIITVGKREQENSQISLRILGSEENLTMNLDDFIKEYSSKILMPGL